MRGPLVVASLTLQAFSLAKAWNVRPRQLLHRELGAAGACAAFFAKPVWPAGADGTNEFAQTLPIQIETPFGPVAGTPSMFILPTLGIVSAIAGLAFAAATDGQPSVYREASHKSSPFGRSVEETIAQLREDEDDDVE